MGAQIGINIKYFPLKKEKTNCSKKHEAFSGSLAVDKAKDMLQQVKISYLMFVTPDIVSILPMYCIHYMCCIY